MMRSALLFGLAFILTPILALILTPAPLLAADEPLPNILCPVLPSEPALREHTLEYEGRTIYFCCESCVEKFRANPSVYLAELPAVSVPPTNPEDSWHWWDLIDLGETAIFQAAEHRILSGGCLAMLTLALMTRVRRRGAVVNGEPPLSRVALVARFLWRPFPVLLFFLTILVVDLAYSWHSHAAITTFLNQHRLTVLALVVVCGFGLIAHLAAHAGLGADRRLGRTLAHLGHPGLVLILSLCGVSWILWQELATARLAAHVAQTRAQELSTALKIASPNPLGWAWPQAFHQLPRGVQNTYYRGNDERSDKLFNKGNYRTATFQVSLRREAGDRVAIGDKLGDVPLAIRWEIDRGPQTADNFFSKQLMKKTFITNGYGDTAKTIPATVVEPARRWQMEMPIGQARGTDYQAIRGVFYCCLANGATHSLETAIVHYYIQYVLHFQNGVLLPESTVWMVPVYPSPILHGPTADGEWFSDRPIPEITGQNTQDPKLLGVPGAQ